MDKCFITPSFGIDKMYYDELKTHFNFSEGVLNAKIGVWQQKHNTDDIPTITQLELYEKELDNQTATREELESIRQRAIANGTFMKAPNGKPTNLTEQQWLQVRTRAFKRWFGDWEAAAKKSNESTNINTNNVFTRSLFRGQAQKPVIDDEGNLHLQTNWDELSQLDTLSFDETEKGASEYGHRAAVSPYIIEVDESYLDSVTPKGEYSRQKVKNKDSFRYDEEFNEVRLSFNGELIIPKGKYNVKHSSSTKQLTSIEDALSEISRLIQYQERRELQEGRGTSEIEGAVSDSDINELYESLKSQLGTYNGDSVFDILYDFLAKDTQSGSPVGPSSNFNRFKKNGAYTEVITTKQVPLFNPVTGEPDLSRTTTIRESHLELSQDLENAISNSLTNHNDDSVSKVVDENGEPLVVYHHTDNPNLTKFSTDFNNYFAQDGGTKKAIFFDENTHGTLGREYDIPVFLNIRNLNEYNETKDQLHQRGTTYRQVVNESAEADDMTGGVHMKDFDDNKMEHQSIWIAHNSNQIKSAESNNGEFSQTDDNIYNNQELDQSPIKVYTQKILKSLIDSHLIGRYNTTDKYYVIKHRGLMTEISKRGLKEEEKVVLENNLKEVIKELTSKGIPKNAIIVERNDNSTTIRINYRYMESYYNRMKDKVARNTSKEEKVDTILSFLEQKTGVLVNRDSKGRIAKIGYGTARKINPNINRSTNAFVAPNEHGIPTVYFIKGRPINTDIASEEMLHPFVASIKQMNTDAFKSLLKDAKEAYPKLAIDIQSSYTNNQDEELVTQALSRALREDLSKYPEGHPIKNIVKKFIGYLKELFSPNSWGMIVDNPIKGIAADDLAHDITIDDLAEMINSEFFLQTVRINEARANQEQSSEPINIYAGAGQHTELSNFAHRPFVANFSNFHFPNGIKEYHANSVEQAFQWAKFMYASLIYLNPNGTWNNEQRVAELLQAANSVTQAQTAAQAKSIGRKALQLTPEEIQFWDNNASSVMKYFITESFKQNPQMLQALLATGDATLTHTQDTSKWGTEFPRILMEVRDELSGKKQGKVGENNTTESTTPKFKGAMSFSYGTERREGVTSETTLDAIRNGERTATTRYTTDGNIDYWSNAKVGDIIEFHNSKGEKVLVRVTKPLTKLDTSTSPEEWSKKEGWSINHFNTKVLPRIQRGEAYQMEYEVVSNDGKTSNIFDVNSLDFGGNEKLKNLAIKIFKIVNDLGIKVKYVDSAYLGDENITGRYRADARELAINKDNVLPNTILHEAIHAVTSYYLNTNDSDRKKFSKEVQAAIKEVEHCYNLLKQYYIEKHFYENGKPKKGVDIENAFRFWVDGSDLYGLTSPQELVAELSRPELIDFIREYDNTHKENKSIFQKLIDAVATLIGIKSYSSVEKTLKDALITFVENPSKELSDKYADEVGRARQNIKEVQSKIDNIVYIDDKRILDKLDDLDADENGLSEEFEYKTFVDDIGSDEKTTKPFTTPGPGNLLIRYRDPHYPLYLISTKPPKVTKEKPFENDDTEYRMVTLTLRAVSMTAFKKYNLNLQKGSSNAFYTDILDQIEKESESVKQQPTQSSLRKPLTPEQVAKDFNYNPSTTSKHRIPIGNTPSVVERITLEGLNTVENNAFSRLIKGFINLNTNHLTGNTKVSNKDFYAKYSKVLLAIGTREDEVEYLKDSSEECTWSNDYIARLELMKSVPESVLKKYAKMLHDEDLDGNEYMEGAQEQKNVLEALPITYEYYDRNQLELPLSGTANTAEKKEEKPNPETFVMQSGGAIGADSIWGRIALTFGVKWQNHWFHGQKSAGNAPNGNIQISDADFAEGQSKVAEAAKANWGYQYATMKDDRLVRNWAQVKYADAIYAIGHLVRPGERMFPNQTNDTRVCTNPNGAVQGGTGYAVEMAIQANKPVYVYDQERKQWFTKQPNKQWTKCDTPTLTQHFAGIGTREINADGEQAITDAFEKTFGKKEQIQQQQNKQEQQTEYTQDGMIQNDINSDLGHEMYRTWTPKVISMRAYRIAKMFSDEVTTLEKRLLKEERTSSTLENRKYVITTKYGAENIFEAVKERIQHTYANRDWVTEYIHEMYDEQDWNNQVLLDKIDYIVQQGELMLKFFDPLKMEANNEIKQNESVSIITKDGEIISVNEEDDETDENIFAKHEEGYFSKVHEESTVETLDREIRLIMSNIYDMDEGNYNRFDDLEEPIPYDFSYIHATTLSVVSKVLSDTDMIPALQRAVTAYPWMQQVIDILLGEDSFTSKIYEGMSDEEKKAKTLDLQAKFWNGYHKIHVNIATQTVNEDVSENNGVICTIVNNPEGEEAAFRSFENICYTGKAIYKGGTRCDSVYDANGKFNYGIYKVLVNRWQQSGLYNKLTQNVKFTPAEIDLVDRLLKAWGIDIPVVNIENLLNPTDVNDNELASILDKRTQLLDVFKQFYSDNRSAGTPLASVLNDTTPLNIFDAFKTNYHVVASIFADTTMGYEESAARFRVEGETKRLFSHILPNPIHTIFNKLRNLDKVSEEQYKERLKKDYLNNWWFNPIRSTTGEVNPWTIRNGWLRDLFMYPKFRKSIRLKTLKSSKEISYANEIDAQAEITRLNEFFNSANRRRIDIGGKNFYIVTDYSVPAFSDTSESYYCSGRYFDTTDPAQLNELMYHLMDVFKQELERIRLVRRRAEITKSYIEAGQKSPIEAIASWDISFKYENGQWIEDTSKPSGNSFHFFPSLNGNLEEMLDNINNANPTEQDNLIRKYVRDAMSSEFDYYIEQFNSWGVNKLAKSPYKETERKKLVDYINNFLNTQNSYLPSLSDQSRTEINSYLRKLANETMTESTYNSYLQAICNIIERDCTSEVERQNLAILRNGLNDFKLDKTNIQKLYDYFINSFYATTQIYELTMRDPAFLGTPDKSQKRFKQFYSPVATCYTSHYMYDANHNIVEVFDLTGTTIDAEGNRVNNETSITLKDNLMKEALSFDNLVAAINKQVARGRITKEQANEIIDNMRQCQSNDEGINSADAQCYRTLPSWQKCLNCIGQASNTKAQEAMKRLQDGNWTFEDYNTVWQVFKPFVSSYMNIDSHANETLPDGSTLEELNPQYDKINAPTQHKNSEFLMLAIYSQLSGVLSGSEKFKALNQFMVDHGIDKVQFESAVKVSNQGCIDLNNCNTREEVIGTLEHCTGLTGKMKASEGNQDVIHTIPFADWGISTSMPEHLLEHEKSSLGTQIMKIIMEDLHDGMTIRIGNYTKTKEQWLELYQALFTEDLKESFGKISEELTNTEKLAAYLKKQICTQNKYSQDLIKHLELDENGNFKYPIIDPMLRSQFDSLCASLLRNGVTKRPFKMGALPQVASWGFEDKLQLRFQDDEGNLILTEDEFNKIQSEGKDVVVNDTEVLPDGSTDTIERTINTWDEYKQYASTKSTRIAYLEVFMPIFDNNFDRNIYNAFVDKTTGEVNFDKLLEKVDPKLLEVLGYRVPSEAKHSMIPMKVKGFLPKQNSSCVMIAPEWIAISDSDNDGDKLYTLFYESEVVMKKPWEIKKAFAKAHGFTYYNQSQREDLLKNRTDTKPKDRAQSDALDQYWQMIQAGMAIMDKNGKVFEEYVHSPEAIETIRPIQYQLKDIPRIEGESESSYRHRQEMESITDNSPAARNNLRLSLMESVLQTEENTAQILTPGGFPEAKRVAKYMKKLLGIAENVASICNPATRVIHQVRNMAGANLISIYANYRSLRPLMQHANLILNESCRITINGNKSLPKNNLGVPSWSLSALRNAEGKYITDNIGNYLGCAVDNAKDPLLSHLGQTILTSPISMILINLGYSVKEVSLFMHQPAIQSIVREYYLNEKTISLRTLINKAKLGLENDPLFYEGTVANVQDLPIEMMEEQIQRKTAGLPQDANDLIIQHQVLVTLEKILPASDALNEINTITRADTQNGSAKSKSAENKQLILKIQSLIDKLDSDADSYPILNAKNLIPTVDEHNVDTDIKNAMLPQVAAFRAFGIDSIPKLFKNISFTFNDLVNAVHTKALELSGKMSLSSDTIDALTDATASYYLSQIPAFSMQGISAKDYRNNTIRQAVNVLIDIKRRGLIKDHILIDDLIANSIGTPYSKNMPFIMLPRNSRKNQGAITNYRRAWESLLANGDTQISVNIYGQTYTITYKDLSDLLLRYCFFINGMSQRGTSFINCYPPSRVSDILGYVSMLKTLSYSHSSGTNDIKIISQYVANNPEDDTFTHAISSKDFSSLILKDSPVIPTRITLNKGSLSTNKGLAPLLLSNVDKYIPYPFVYVNINGNRILYRGSKTNDFQVDFIRCNVLGNTENGYLQEYETGKDIKYGDIESVSSIIPANNMPSILDRTSMQKTFSMKQQEHPNIAITPNEIRDILQGLVGKSSVVTVDAKMGSYNPQTNDLTGVEFCTII